MRFENKAAIAAPQRASRPTRPNRAFSATVKSAFPPSSRRYLRARRVLSLRSRRQAGDYPSSSAAQFTPLRNRSSSASSACM
jgi:hypothetical protein